MTLVLLAIFAIRFLATPPALLPTTLECEAMVNPVGIDIQHPRLSWNFEIVRNNTDGNSHMPRWGNESSILGAEKPISDARQTAYQIETASSVVDLVTNHPDLWNSGKITSKETLDIAYQGKALRSAQEVYWRVRSWDQNGKLSQWSSPAGWTMHLLHPSDWTAKWIGAPTTENKPVTIYLRKNVLFNSKPNRVLAFVSGLGQYSLTIDGIAIGASLAPSWTQYQKSVVVDEFDVTDLFKPGNHALALMIGNGFYNMSADKRGGQETNSIGQVRGFLQLRVEYPNGKVENVGTDSSWKTHPTPATYSGEYGGEDWDGRKEIPNWSLTSANLGSWNNAQELPITASLYGLSHAAPPVETDHQELGETVHKTKTLEVLDFHYNCPRVPMFFVQGPAGTVVKASPAESLNANGTVNQNSMRPGKYFSYTLKGGQMPELYKPSFIYVGSRYWQIEAMDPKGNPIDPQSVVVNFSTFPEFSTNLSVGQFQCSNKLLNQINDLIRGSMKSNLASVISDCPHREKSGWLEEDHLMGPSLMYCFDMRQLFAKAVSEMVDAQHPDGREPTMAPEYFYYDGPFSDSDEWGGSLLLVPKLMQSWYGNNSIIADHLPSMIQYVDYLTTQSKDGILSTGLGDWDGGGTDPRTPAELTNTAYYFALCQNLAHFIPEPNPLRQKYSLLAEKIKTAFNAKYLDPTTGKYGTGSQSGQATALDLGLVPKNMEEMAFNQMVVDIKAHDYSVSCGEVGHPSMLRVLASHGRSDIIARIHLQTEKPGYGYQIKHGYTTLTESWDGSNSQNHFMLGHLMEWLYGGLVGIQPISDAFQTFAVHPLPVNEVTWAKASYASPRGLIQASWKIVNHVFTLTVRVPVNCQAEITMPLPGHQRSDALESTGIYESDRIKTHFTVGSGFHTFSEPYYPVLK